MATYRNLVILFHGVGARGADLSPLGRVWGRNLPNTDFSAPDAPFPFDGGGPLHQWFSLAGISPDNRPDRVAAARPAFDRVVQGILDWHGMADRLDRVVFVGFSQGTIMALDAFATGRWPVAAVLGYSGRLATRDPLRARTASRVLLVHGSADTAVPPEESEVAAPRLRAAGVDTALRILPKLGHTISPEGAGLGGAFLTEVLMAREVSGG